MEPSQEEDRVREEIVWTSFGAKPIMKIPKGGKGEEQEFVLLFFVAHL
jgi:hypothetical protein